MKKILLVLVVLFGSVLTQDVRIPGNLLEALTTLNSTDVEYEEATTELEADATTNGTWIDEVTEETPPPENLVRQPNVVQPNYPAYPGAYPIYPNYPPQPRPCDVVQPSPEFYYPQPEQQPFPIQTEPEYEPVRPSPPIIVPPIYDTQLDLAEKEEIRSCPIGSFQNGSACVSLYSNNCPNGYEWKDERCVLSRVICPLNFELKGRTCVQRRICPVNHILNNGQCVQPYPECPSGYTWNGESCEIINIQCEAGSVLRGNECVIESFTCPKGFRLEGEECVRPDPICQQGFELEQSSGFCVRTNDRCPSGSVLINGECRRTIVSCPAGSYMENGACYRIVTATPRPIPPRRTTLPPQIVPTRAPPSQRLVCPKDFTLKNNLCYRCPPSYNLCNNQCLRGNVCPQQPLPQPLPISTNCQPNYPCHSYPPYAPQTFPSNINVNLISRTPQGPILASQGYNIVNNIAPINNTIHNFNNVSHPVTLNNVNINNIYIYSETQCPDGSIRTVVVKNNETINGCVDVVNNRTEGENLFNVAEENKEQENEKCCEVVTPRQCKQRHEDSWQCTHKRYRYCGRFCIADRLYLKPPATTYQNNVLTIAPSQHNQAAPCFGRSCPAVDCSGCTDGSFNCSSQCYTYPCNHAGCTYLDQTDFCSVVGGQICE